MSRRFQFSLKALLVATTIIGVFLGLPLSAARRRAEIVRHIQQSGGDAFYRTGIDYNCFGGPPTISTSTRARMLMSRVFGPDLFFDVTTVYLEGPQVTADLLRELPELSGVSYVLLDDVPSVTVRDIDALQTAIPGCTIEIECDGVRETW